MVRNFVKTSLFALLSVAGGPAAFADSVPISYSTTSTGTSGSGVDSTLPTGVYTYSNSFAAGVGQAAIAGTSGSGFYDDYVFSVSGVSADSVASTINLGNTFEIDNLQVALFNYVTGQTVPIDGTSTAQAQGWSTAFSAGPTTNGTVSVISPTALAAGTYALEIRGTVNGTAGGAYTGQIELSPVPVPPALPLLVSALAGLGWKVRRRRSVDITE